MLSADPQGFAGMITDRVSLQEALAAFGRAERRQGTKVLIAPTTDEIDTGSEAPLQKKI
jgi:hypothetical protein